MNKNISVWRGEKTPPTKYHLWQKGDAIYVNIEDEWLPLASVESIILLEEVITNLNRIKDIELAEVNASNNNILKSYRLKSGDNYFGTTIDIPKDRAIKDIKLGYLNASVNSETGEITIGTGTNPLYMIYSIALEDGSYKMISIDLSLFITEKEYKDGLELVDNALLIKIDKNSDPLLTVSSNGVKLEGVQGKFNSLDTDVATIKEYLAGKLDKASVVQKLGEAEDKVMSQKAVSNKFNELITLLKAEFSYKGIATPTTNPGTPDGNVFYIATTAGTYSNFGGIQIVDGEAVILEWSNNSWIKKTTGLTTQAKLIELTNNQGIYNVDTNIPLESGFYNSIQARVAVPTSVRKLGLIITYKTDETTSVVEQFIGSVVSEWVTETNWKNVGSEGGNKILQWNTDVATTRKQVPLKERKAGMQISYKPTDSDWVNEQYIGTSFTDPEWVNEKNWKKILDEYSSIIKPNKKYSINSVYSTSYVDGKIGKEDIPIYELTNLVEKLNTVGYIDVDGNIRTEKSEDYFNAFTPLYEIQPNTDISYSLIAWQPDSLLLALYNEEIKLVNSVSNTQPGTNIKGTINSGNAKFIAIHQTKLGDISSYYCNCYVKPTIGDYVKKLYYSTEELIPVANVIEGDADKIYKVNSDLYNLFKSYLGRELQIGDKIKYQRYKDVYEVAEIKDEFSVALEGHPYNYNKYKLGVISYNNKISEFKKELHAISTVAGGGSYRYNKYRVDDYYTTHFIPIENALESDSINFRGTTTTEYSGVIAWGFSKDATLTADNYITKFEEASYQNSYSTRYWNIVIPMNEIPRDAKFIFYTRKDKTQDDIALFIKPNYKRTYDIVGEGTVYRHLVNMKFVPISEGSGFLYLGKKFLQVIPGSKFRYRIPAYTYIEIFDSSKKSIRKYGDKTANDPKIYEDTFAENECFITYRGYKNTKEQAFLEIEAMQSTVVENEIGNYQNGKNGIGGMYDNFSVKVNYNEEDLINNSPTELQDTPNYYDDWGVIALPENYNAIGKPTRLIIYCQGSGDRTDSGTNPIPNTCWKYLLAKGYAVMDMNGMSSEWGTKKGFPVTTHHYGNKYVLQSYKKGYDYVMNKYNLYKEVYVFGLSMGGLSSFMITQSGIIPVIAQCNFCPVISVYKQAYMHPWGGDNQKKTIAGQWNFDNWKDNSNFDQAYFLSNIDKIKGYDNLLTNVIGSTIGTANENYGNDEEKNAYEALSKIFPVPLKIWHSEDDNTVLIRYSEFMVKMINNAGGKAWLRKMSTGDHVGGWNNGSITDNEVVSGESIDTSIPFYEAVKFIQRYE